MSNRVKIKKTKIMHPYFAAIYHEQCPKCGSRIGEVFEVRGVSVQEDEVGCACTSCEWECILGFGNEKNHVALEGKH